MYSVSLYSGSERSIKDDISSDGHSHLRAAACKYQTSPDSSKKSTSILFHEKNPYIELFSKMEFKRFSELYFSRNRPDKAWR